MSERLFVTAIAGRSLVVYDQAGVQRARWSSADDVDASRAVVDARPWPQLRSWALEVLDGALVRAGYRRLGEWANGDLGPRCAVECVR